MGQAKKEGLRHEETSAFLHGLVREDDGGMLLCVPEEGGEWPTRLDNIGEMIEREPGEGDFVRLEDLNAEVRRIERAEPKVIRLESTPDNTVEICFEDGEHMEWTDLPDGETGELLMETILRFAQGEEPCDCLTGREETAEDRMNRTMEREADR